MLEINNLFINFNKQEILKNISFKLNKGEFLYILGPNGSGKTTLIKSILKLVKPSSGKIVNNFKTVSTLFQKQVDSANFPASVFEILKCSQNSKLSSISFNHKIDKWLGIMKISNLKNKLIGELSGGELQRVMFIKTILNEPELLILDEPTSAIDPDFRKEFNKILDNINKKGTAIILITHDLSGLNPYCKNKVLFLDREIKFYGSFCDYHIKYGDKDVHHRDTI